MASRPRKRPRALPPRDHHPMNSIRTLRHRTALGVLLGLMFSLNPVFAQSPPPTEGGGNPDVPALPVGGLYERGIRI